MKPLLKTEEHTAESLPHEPVITVEKSKELLDEIDKLKKDGGKSYDQWQYYCQGWNECLERVKQIIKVKRFNN